MFITRMFGAAKWKSAEFISFVQLGYTVTALKC